MVIEPKHEPNAHKPTPLPHLVNGLDTPTHTGTLMK